MRFLEVAVFAAGLLFAQQAAASSFVVLDGPRDGPSPSVIVLGEPALGDPPVVSAPPDETIRTAALPPVGEAPQDAAAALFGFAAGEDVAPDWPPPLSVSMVALGDPPSPSARQEASKRRGAPFSLPTVIRGGLVGDAYPVAATPSDVRPAVTGQPVSPSTPATDEPIEKAPAMAEQRGSLPPDKPSRRDPQPEPAGPPPAPAPPPPPTQRLE